MTQECLQCSAYCQSCFNQSENSCIDCKQPYFKSSLNSSTCVQSCQNGEIYLKNKQCIKCNVQGCKLCDQNQICLKCEANLSLDISLNECIIKNNICKQQQFISAPFTQNECFNSCPSSYYQNFQTQICEKMLQCIQIDNSLMSLEDRVLQIEYISNNQYLVRANQCNFALVNQDWNIINLQILQNQQDYKSQYMVAGQEQFQKSFIIRQYGGCTAGNTLILMNFTNLQTLFIQTEEGQNQSANKQQNNF
ncbi:zinc finger protein (macronuclear) [Tetrahymena thermophila SB210]|uniref:Zinc finger protein n=1 Tax=Tetrahymena thermophila (strain SB210) TaxID=312017 RepID=Q23TW1_TETTS|nr:zinc finger protein [Tetrahymena thermophila SB210]EAR99934.1 zinc finger protein [Tetrahymena thermophila SB210]|eukprot:XP_001020179.1 zinc finger protein [Tetrahymena thermophila SB210]